MADEQSMTARGALGKVLGDEHADVLRESVRIVLGELMEMEVLELAGARGVGSLWPGESASTVALTSLRCVSDQTIAIVRRILERRG